MTDTAELLRSFTPIVTAVAGIVGGLVVLTKNFQKVVHLLVPSDQTQTIVELRLLSETRLEMYNAVQEQLRAERAEHAETREERDFARRSADECERRRRDLEDRYVALARDERADRKSEGLTR